MIIKRLHFPAISTPAAAVASITSVVPISQSLLLLLLLLLESFNPQLCLCVKQARYGEKQQLATTISYVAILCEWENKQRSAKRARETISSEKCVTTV